VERVACPTAQRRQEFAVSHTQLVYYSRNRIDTTERSLLVQLREILRLAQRKNGADDVTGFLLFDKGWFIQVLEGDEQRVSRVYDRIKTDPRHIVLLGRRPAKRRNFLNWSMGGAIRTPDKYPIFLRHGVGETLDPAKLTLDSVVTLAAELVAYEIGGAANEEAA